MTSLAHSAPYIVSPFAETALTHLRQGYSPLPAIGQACIIKGWTQYATAPLSIAEIERLGQSSIPYNVALALGFNRLVMVDRDTDDPRVRDALRPIFSCIYSRGGVPVAKFGSKGLATFFLWRGSEAFRNRSFIGVDGEVLLELSGAGRAAILPPSIHPKTGQPYRWVTARTLLDTRPDELPALLPEDVLAIEKALAPFMRPPRAPVPIRPSVIAADLDEQGRRRHEAYARRILETECRELAAMAPDTGRNKRAFGIVCRVGKWVHHQILPADELSAAVISACAENRLLAESGQHAVVATINSGLAKSQHDELPDLGGRR